MSTESHASAGGRPPATVKVAVIDSGVHASHPHVGGIAGGVAIDADGRLSDDWTDRIGHGTAVAAAIREKAPLAEIHAVRIFSERLSASASTLIAGIDWAVEAGMQVINLSLGTSNVRHRDRFDAAIARALHAGAVIVAARDDDGVEWLPGCLPGVLGVQVDWECPRDQFRVAEVAGTTVFRASGFARPIPGVDPRRNLNGISFAVANMSGFLARAICVAPTALPGEAVQRLARFAQLPIYGGGPDGAAPATDRFRASL